MAASAEVVTSGSKVHLGPSDAATSTKALPKPSKVRTIEDDRIDAAKDLVRALSDTVRYAYEAAEQYERAMRNEDHFAARHSVLVVLGRVLNLQRANGRASNLVGALRDLYTGVVRLELHFDGDDPRDVMLTYLDPFAEWQHKRTPRDMLEVFACQVDRIADAIKQVNFDVQKAKVPYKSYHTYSLARQITQRSAALSVPGRIESAS